MILLYTSVFGVFNYQEPSAFQNPPIQTMAPLHQSHELSAAVEVQAIKDRPMEIQQGIISPIFACDAPAIKTKLQPWLRKHQNLQKIYQKMMLHEQTPYFFFDKRLYNNKHKPQKDGGCFWMLLGFHLPSKHPSGAPLVASKRFRHPVAKPHCCGASAWDRTTKTTSPETPKWEDHGKGRSQSLTEWFQHC